MHGVQTGNFISLWVFFENVHDKLFISKADLHYAFLYFLVDLYCFRFLIPILVCKLNYLFIIKSCSNFYLKMQNPFFNSKFVLWHVVSIWNWNRKQQILAFKTKKATRNALNLLAIAWKTTRCHSDANSWNPINMAKTNKLNARTRLPQILSVVDEICRKCWKNSQQICCKITQSTWSSWNQNLSCTHTAWHQRQMVFCYMTNCSAKRGEFGEQIMWFIILNESSLRHSFGQIFLYMPIIHQGINLINCHRVSVKCIEFDPAAGTYSL